jgi:peptidoglycan/LPS O-acetylase OafA/YrhL
VPDGRAAKIPRTGNQPPRLDDDARLSLAVRRHDSSHSFAPQPPPLGYRPALDGLRGVSVLCVMGFHSFLLPGGGFLGVDIFFVLSGFLITNLLLAERAATGSLQLRRFYVRRARRLVPGLLVAVTAFLLISAVSDQNGFPDDALAAAAGITYITNVLVSIVPAWLPGIEHLWSLAAEEQFYLLWPLVLIAAMRRGVSRRGLTIGVGLVVLAIWVDRLALTLAGASQHRLYFAPDTSLDPIVIGCLLALLHDGGYVGRACTNAFMRTRVVPASLGIALGLILGVPDTGPRWIYEWGLPVFGVAVAIVLGSVVTDPKSPVAAVLARGRLVALGRISYGVYLWHPILLYAAHVPKLASIPCAIGAAALSNRYVEQRFRRRPQAPLPPAPIVATA